MAVSYNCKYCGNEIISDMSFTGKISDFNNYMESRVLELSNNCVCQNAVKMSKGACITGLRDLIDDRKALISEKDAVIAYDIKVLERAIELITNMEV